MGSRLRFWEKKIFRKVFYTKKSTRKYSMGRRYPESFYAKKTSRRYSIRRRTPGGLTNEETHQKSFYAMKTSRRPSIRRRSPEVFQCKENFQNVFGWNIMHESAENVILWRSSKKIIYCLSFSLLQREVLLKVCCV